MEKHQLITLKLVGFNESENKSLNAILTLAERGLKAQWQIVENISANFFLLSSHSTNQFNNDPILQKLPRELCIFCITDKNNPPNANTLVVDEKGTPSLRALVDLFNKLSEQDKMHTITSKITIENSQDEIEFFDFDQGFLGYLLNTKKDVFMIELLNKIEYPPIYIDNKKDCYYSQHNLKQLYDYIIEIDHLIATPLSEKEQLSFIKTNKLKPQPLKNLIWYATLKSSTGKVIKGYSRTDIITLTKWPDLRLPDCINHAKLTSFMKNNAATLPTISEQTKIPLEEIYPFYNACYLIGLIELRLETELNKKKITPERLKLLSQIGTRLER